MSDAKETREPPHYIAIEGPIGVGKTSLARRLASTFNKDLVLEPTFENPFLERFYRQGAAYALPTQLYFLLRRGELLRDTSQRDLFKLGLVADFILEKDPLFAQLTLTKDEHALYQALYERMTLDIVRPDLVIYLQASPEVLAERIRERGIAAEQRINRDYLQALCNAYAELFHYYESSRLLIINAENADLYRDDQQFDELIQRILNGRGPREYYNPQPKLI